MTAVEAACLDEDLTVADAPLSIEHGEHSSTSDTGLAVWDGALILSKFLEFELTASALTGAAVLDLGAGCGVTSIVAAALGARVSATDLPYSLPLLRRNVDSNAELLAAAGGSVAVDTLDWLATAADGANKLLANVDVVLAADVIWDEELVEPMLRTVERALAGSSVAGASSTSIRPTVPFAPERSPESCCCCKLLDAQEHSAEAAQLASEMGLDDLCGAPISPGGVICAEADWLAGQRERRVPVCYLAYTFRLDSVDAALQRCLLGTAASGATGGRRFCVSEVPPHRVPWQSLGRGGSAGRDCSDESSPPVRILRVQRACGETGK
jgi:predicted nicotinamide N-methyase